MKIQTEVVSRISAHMQVTHKKKFKEFEGHFKSTWELHQYIDPSFGDFKPFLQTFSHNEDDKGNFKESDYV